MKLVFFLECMDSRLEEGGKWYARFYIGPFRGETRLLIGLSICRSLLYDLTQVLIIALDLTGVVHEFTLLEVISTPILDLSFQFRKREFSTPFLNYGGTIIIPFLFFGPSKCYIKDIFWP